MSPAQPRRVVACIAGMALILGAACASPIKTTHDFDPDANFSRYKTYAWIPHDAGIENPLLYSNPKLRGWILDAVDSQLQSKGIQKVDYGKADFTLAFQVRSRKVPVVIRLTGTNEQQAREILTSIGLEATTSMEDGVREAIAMAGGGR